MSHLCEQLVEAAQYLQSKGMSQQQLSALHHFSAKGREVTFASIIKYFGINKNLRANNIQFAERLKFVATEHRRTGKNLNVLVQEALNRWSL
jgi:hypothetical protein